MSRAEIIKAYRTMYRTSLQAVMYSKPARFVVRDQLRDAFRDPSGHFDMEAIRRTVLFLRSAARERGLAHNIVKNLVYMAWCQRQSEAVPYHIVLLQASQRQK